MEEDFSVSLNYVVDHDELGDCVKIYSKIKERPISEDEDEMMNPVSTPSVSESSDDVIDPGIRFSRMFQWWRTNSPTYAPNNPRIKSKLENLMETNVVRITDGNYWKKLQGKMKEKHLEKQRNRINNREEEEVERLKKLVLEGSILLENAPKELKIELKNHPVFKVTRRTKKILYEKGLKVKLSRKTNGYKTSSKKIEEAERIKQCENSSDKGDIDGDDDGKLSETAGYLSIVDDETEDIAKGLMFTQEEYEKRKYESPLIKKLKDVHNVDEMYALAEEIVGKHVKTTKD